MIDMYASQTGILTALHTIQDECVTHDNCFGCPFRIDIDNVCVVKCGIRMLDPADWDINDVMDWRAFK